MRNNNGVTVWFTGLPCSGKTTVADRVRDILEAEYDVNVERLDGDIVRKSLTADLGFSKEDRDENIKRVTFVAKLLTRNGVIVLLSFVSPYIERRNRAREEIGSMIETFVHCPMEVCEQRDVKGMYRLAREGKIKSFTGVDDPYEEPPEPDLVLHAHLETVEESARKVVGKLKEKGYLD